MRNAPLIRLLCAALCLLLLCACVSGNASQNNAGSSGGEVIASDDTGKGEESPAQESTPMAEEDVAQWEAFFNTTENNGLLRFPYADLSGDPEQIAPYLSLLFYDIGDPRSEISEDEIAQLAARDFWMETDLFRLRREFMTEYLLTKLNIPAGTSESLLDMGFGLDSYLLEYDAWYMCHGDTNVSFYDFDRGEVFGDGTVKLYYYQECIPLPESGFADAHMAVTLAQKNGQWYVLANEIVEIVEIAQ